MHQYLLLKIHLLCCYIILLITQYQVINPCCLPPKYVYLQAKERCLSKQNYAFQHKYTDQAQSSNQKYLQMLFFLFTKQKVKRNLFLFKAILRNTVTSNTKVFYKKKSHQTPKEDR